MTFPTVPLASGSRWQWILTRWMTSSSAYYLKLWRMPISALTRQIMRGLILTVSGADGPGGDGGSPPGAVASVGRPLVGVTEVVLHWSEIFDEIGFASVALLPAVRE